MAFSAQLLKKDIQRIIDDGVKDYESHIIGIMQAAYEQIVDSSPVWTGYYASNHTVTIRGGGGQFAKGSTGPFLRPGIKETDQKFAYAGNIEDRKEEELSRINQFKIGQIIGISTIVPYADEVEQKHNVYQSAAAAFGLDFGED